MIAAVYARKSTEQTGTDADAKSTARQIENARAFAASHGWTVPDDHVYKDEAISGAETRKLVNRQRLLDAIDSGRPPFRVLIMRDASRLSRRDGDEAFGELKRIAQAGVAIHFYQDATRFTFGTFGDNVVGFVRAEMNAEYRRQIARFTKEAMVRKAQAGHVTGGRVFGYDNVRVNGHTERRINEAQAAVIRRIFDLCAEGTGYTRIAKHLNDDRALTPKPARGRPAGWSPSTVYEVLHRPLYRGEVVYNRTRNRAPDGTREQVARPESEWLRFQREDLRIVSRERWAAAHARLDGIRAHLTEASGGTLGRRRRDIESAYLLSGFARCAVCGASVGVLDRRQYGCIAFHKRGTTVCGNGLKKPIATLDAAVLTTLRADVLRPKAVLATIDLALQQLEPAAVARDRTRRRQEVQILDREIANLTRAIAQGGQLPPLLDALTAHHTRRETLTAAIGIGDAVDVSQIDRHDVTREVRACLDDWQDRLSGRDNDRARQALREILVGPLTLTPDERTYRFEGELLVGSLLRGSDALQPLWRAQQDSRKVATTKFSGMAA